MSSGAAFPRNDLVESMVESLPPNAPSSSSSSFGTTAVTLELELVLLPTAEEQALSPALWEDSDETESTHVRVVHVRFKTFS